MLNITRITTKTSFIAVKSSSYNLLNVGITVMTDKDNRSVMKTHKINLHKNLLSAIDDKMFRNTYSVRSPHQAVTNV